MSIEQGGYEPQNETTETVSRGLDELAKISAAELEAMTEPELRRLHDELISQLGRPDKPARTFEGFVTEKLTPAQRREAQKAGGQVKYLRTFLESHLSTVRAGRRYASDRRLAAERQALSLQHERDVELFESAATARVEHNFTDWNRQREIVDSQGRPGRLYPEDQAFVDRIDLQRDIERAKGDDFFEVTDRLEVGFAQGLDQYDVFGEQATVSIHPSSKYDDYARGVDMIAQIQTPDDVKDIILGIDFTISSSEIDLAKKLRRNAQSPLRATKYATRELPRGVTYLPVVLSIDRRRAERTAIHEAVQQTSADHPGGATMLKKYAEEVAFHRDRAVFQYAVLEEVVAQLRVQEEVFFQRGANIDSMLTYKRAIDYFERLLADRKNLQAVAGLETQQEQAVYRVADEAFIRSAPELVAAAG